MNAVICDICGTKKREANKWWTLFEGESNRAALIGPLEDAQTLQQWIPRTAQSNLCGEGCLYRKLNRVLGPRVNGQGEGTPLGQTSSQHFGADARSFSGKPIGSKVEKSIDFTSFLPPKPRVPLWRRFTIGKDRERTAHDPVLHCANRMTSTKEKLPSTNLRDTATLGEGLKITGQIDSNEPLFVNGELVGTLRLPDHRLTVGANGKIRASVCAKEVEIFGMIEGEVKANKVVIRKNGRLLGDVRTLALVIDAGAWFEGKSIMRLQGVDQQYTHKIGTARGV
jgi:cytoskeletal protein CcmA (bactofilin family)